MFVNFFLELRQAKVPVSIKEYLALMEAMDKHVADYSVDNFYYLSRSVLVKDERNLDKFDRVFGHVFKGLEALPPEGGVDGADEPLGSNGFARVVVPGDSRGGRYVSNLVSLEVIDAVPEPASIILLAAALLALTLVSSVRLAAGPMTRPVLQPGCARLSHRLYCPNGEAHLASRFRTRTGRRPWQDTAARGDP